MNSWRYIAVGIALWGFLEYCMNSAVEAAKVGVHRTMFYELRECESIDLCTMLYGLAEV